MYQNCNCENFRIIRIIRELYWTVWPSVDSCTVYCTLFSTTGTRKIDHWISLPNVPQVWVAPYIHCTVYISTLYSTVPYLRRRRLPVCCCIHKYAVYKSVLYLFYVEDLLICCHTSEQEYKSVLYLIYIEDSCPPVAVQAYKCTKVYCTLST